MGSCACSTGACSCGASGFTVPTAETLASSVIACLTPVIDAARNVAACIGTRRHIVRLVWTGWTGGTRGRGQETIVREEVLTPIPRVSFINDLGIELQNVGFSEAGILRVGEISMRYSSHFLSGRSEDGQAVPRDQEFFYEVEELNPVGSVSLRRRFGLKGPPELRAENGEYVVKLIRANKNDRTPGGVLA